MPERRNADRRKIPFKLTAAVQNVVDRISKNTPSPKRKMMSLCARVVDLSRDGAGLFTRVYSVQPYECGQRILIQIELSDGTILPTEGEVRWITEHPSKRGHLYGVYFLHVDPKDRARLHQFLAELDEVF